ncbi:MAG: hypothetical protein ACPL7K_02415 [Armatimonadota bacterium]
MNRTVHAAIVLAMVGLIVQAAHAVPPTQPMKWSQPIYQIGTAPDGTPLYWGWDEVSFIGPWGGGPQVADDWQCKDRLPVTDFHWWGSYIDWKEPYQPPSKVLGFWFGIYTDIPVQPGVDYSRPGQLIWQFQTTQFTETSSAGTYRSQELRRPRRLSSITFICRRRTGSTSPATIPFSG